MENQPNQAPRKKQSEGENAEQASPSNTPPPAGASIAGAAVAGAAAGAAGSMGAEFIKDLFSDSTATEPSAPLSGVATQTAVGAVQEPEKTEEPGLASSIAQHITEVIEDQIPPPPTTPVAYTTEIPPEWDPEPETVALQSELTPQPEPEPGSPSPVVEADVVPASSQPQSSEAVEFGGYRMELDGNDDGKMDQVVWDVNQDSFVDVIGTDANQDNIITTDELEIINDPATLQKPEEVADPSILFVDVNQDNQPEAMLMDINSDQKADIVMEQGPPQIDYEGEVAGNIPEDVDPSVENEHRQDLSTLDDPFSDLNQWV